MIHIDRITRMHAELDRLSDLDKALDQAIAEQKAAAAADLYLFGIEQVIPDEA